ncbi:MAG: FkbM family methyltransferase [Chthoniobacteraceae bacterium]
MSFRNAILSSLNHLFGLRGMELRGRVRIESDCSMEAGLRRAGAQLPRIGTVIDVGAAAGKWTRLARPHFPDARFFLIEPLRERVPELAALGIDFVSALAGAKPGEAMIDVTDDLDGSGVTDVAGSACRSVAVTTIDREVSERKLPGPYFIKLDTHGYEVPILEGARATLAQTALLMVEAYNFQLTTGCLRFPQLCVRMEELGFLPCDVIEPARRPVDLALWQMDIVFARANAPIFARKTYC